MAEWLQALAEIVIAALMISQLRRDDQHRK
jgi:hypothetical protein